MKYIKTISKWNRVHIKILVLLSIIGLYLRIEPVLFDFTQFSYDQGIDISYVRNFVVDHKISLIGRFTGLEGVFMGPLWTLILTVPYILSGGSPSANVLFFSILGILAIWYTYAIVRKLLSETSALLVAFFVAISQPFISAAHNVISPSPLAIIMIFYIWFLWEVINENKKYIPFLGLLLGLFFQFELGFSIFLVPATFITVFLLNKKAVKPQKELVVSVLLFFSTFLPQILFEFRHEFLMTKSIIKLFTGENASLGYQHENIFQRVVIRTGSLWEDFVFSVVIAQNNLIAGSLILIPSILGYINVLRRKSKQLIRFAGMLLIIILSVYGGFSVYSAPVWTWYRAGFPIIFVLLVSLGWDEFINHNLVRKKLAIFVFLLVTIFAIGPLGHLQNYTSGYQGGVSSIKYQKMALDTIFNDAQENFEVFVYTPPVYTYVWDHMIFWYAQPKYHKQPKDYGYQKSKDTINDFYLLIEPDSVSIRIDGWKGNFHKYGKRVKTWSLPGEITVEKWESDGIDKK